MTEIIDERNVPEAQAPNGAMRVAQTVLDNIVGEDSWI